MDNRWIKLQTHVHTINSDGKDSLRDMAEAARKNNIEAIFLTDHNTIIDNKIVEKISKKVDINIINGIEYTTFYGHIIVIGAPYYRWENIKRNSLNELADYVHSFGGIIGIAHPVGLGDPVCTGGRYCFEDFDFSKIDFMEVWHGVINNLKEWEKNQSFWEDKLKQRIKITALFGGDFHKREHFIESNCFNWALIDEKKSIDIAIKEAIKFGRVIMSKGPCFKLKIIKDSQVYNMGETIELKRQESLCTIELEVECESIDRDILINLVHSNGHVEEVKHIKDNKIYIEMTINNKMNWLRAEILDKINKEVLAISNPIYFKCGAYYIECDKEFTCRSLPLGRINQEVDREM